MKKANVVTTLAIVGIVVAVAGIGWAISEYGGKTYKGRRASEWRRMADDVDYDTRLEGYRGLAATGQMGVLRDKFEGETNAKAKLIIAAATIDDPEMRPRIVGFLRRLLSDPNFGDLYFNDPNFRDVVTHLAWRGESGPVESQIERWTKVGLNKDQAKEVLELITDNKPKAATGLAP